MPRGTYRVLNRRGPATLVESADPASGIHYGIWIGASRHWSGDSLAEAEMQFASTQVRDRLES
jgi:hypothetical protein